jgi:hypothetical protein
MKELSIKELFVGLKLALESDAVQPLARVAIKNATIELLTRYTQSNVDLRCCGNCGNITTINCPHYSVGMLTSDYECWMYCDKWSTDGLKKHERVFTDAINTQDEGKK